MLSDRELRQHLMDLAAMCSGACEVHHTRSAGLVYGRLARMVICSRVNSPAEERYLALRPAGWPLPAQVHEVAHIACSCSRPIIHLDRYSKISGCTFYWAKVVISKILFGQEMLFKKVDFD
jgi:hypothetical protein